MEQEKYKRAIEIAQELDMLNEVIGELNNPRYNNASFLLDMETAKRF